MPQIGNSTSTSSIWSRTDGDYHGYQVVMPENGTLNFVEGRFWYLNSTSTAVAVIQELDGTVVAVSDPYSGSSISEPSGGGLARFNFSSAANLTPQTYWLGVIFSGPSNSAIRYGNGEGVSRRGGAAYPTPPANPGSLTTGDDAYALYIDYTAGDPGLAIDSEPSETRVTESFTITASNPATAPTTANSTLDTGSVSISPDSVSGSGPYALTFTIPRTTLLLMSAAGYTWTLDIAGETVNTSQIPYLPVTGQDFVTLGSSPSTAPGSALEQFAPSDPQAGDQIVYDSVTAPAGVGVTVDDTGQIILDSDPGTDQTFSAYIIGSTVGSVGTITVDIVAGVSNSNIAFSLTPNANRSNQIDSNYADGSAPAIRSDLPFDAIPPKFLINAGEKRVIAHYFTQFPKSISNADPDYYDGGYLNPTGEGGIHEGYGGFLRDAPIIDQSRPRSGADWLDQDIYDEIITAFQYGIDSFAWNILTANRSSYHWERGEILLEQARIANNGFKILVMPDCNAYRSGESDSAALTPYIDDLEYLFTTWPESVYRVEDGRILLCPYNAQQRPASFWEDVINGLASRGLSVLFMPLVQGWTNSSIQDPYKNKPWVYGFSDWGDADAEITRDNWADEVPQADAEGWNFMMPIRVQDHRPRNYLYREAANFLLFKSGWDNAINTGAAGSKMVQLVTWNDYSEHTEFAPSRRNLTAPLELTYYYSQWFKTGIAPTIVRDVVYWSHRKHLSSLVQTQSQNNQFSNAGSSATRDEIELLAFLKEPATLQILIDGVVRSSSAVPAGIQSITCPLEVGQPSFKVVRDSTDVIDVNSHEQVVSSIDYQDFHYAFSHAGES